MKKLQIICLVFFAALLLFALPSKSYAATLFFDNFNDADGPIQAHNSRYTNISGGAITGNRAQGFFSLQEFTQSDICVSLTYSWPDSPDLKIYLRYSPTQYNYLTFSTQAAIKVFDTESLLALEGLNDSFGNHVAKFCSSGNTLTGYFDGTQRIQTTAPSLYSGYIAINAVSPMDNLLVEGDLPTPTPTPAPSVKIVSSPSSGNTTVGTPFNVDVKVQDNNGAAFNAAQATVAVSSNLSITGLHNPSSNACNLQYTKTPSAGDPSFAGAIFGGSSTGCTVYTLTLTPTSVGTGTITFTNGSVKSYANSSEILTGVTNGSFTINTAVPTPTPVGQTVNSIDDSVQGTGSSQWNYVSSGWNHCTSCNDTATWYNSSISWDNTTDDYVTLNFTGTQVGLYGFTDPRDGIGAVSIDGGAETMVDFYSATRTGNVLLWTSPSLANTSHTLKLRVTGTHSSSSTDTYIGPDRATVTTSAPNTSLTFNTYPLDTYLSTLSLSGGRDASLTSIFVNGNSSNTTYPTTTTWQAPINLVLGNNTFTVYGADSENNQTATQSIQINRHTLGDINGDGLIDLTDASLFAVDYGKTSNLTYPLSDMNGDGNVDLTDLSILAKFEN